MKQKKIMSLAGALVILMSAVGLLTSCLQSNSVLEGNVFQRETDLNLCFYFSGGVVYQVQNNSDRWVKYNVGTYKGKSVTANIPMQASSEVVVKEDGIELFGMHWKRVTDQALIDKIKNLPVTKL